MTSYYEIFLALKHPKIAHHTFTPQSKQDWKRFFGMMDTLERNQIATFQNGRYGLHPSRKADVVEKAEAVLADMSKPLTLPAEMEADFVEASTSAPVMPQFNPCPTCKNKGRVNIEDTLGYFGSFLCLTCAGKKQIPVPSRSTFPPVDLSAKRETPNALLFSSNSIPQALEVGGVRVIVEAPVPVLSMPSITVEEAAEGLMAIAEPMTLISADCFFCKGLGVVEDPNSQHPYVRVMACNMCGGTGEDTGTGVTVLLDDSTQPLPVLDSPQDELIDEVEQAQMSIVMDFLADFDGEIPEVSTEAPALRTPRAELPVDILAQIKKRGEEFDQLENSFSGKEREAIQKERVILKSFEHQLVRVNWTGRGLSSGQFQLLSVIRQYGKNWYLVKMETDKVYHKPMLPELCELVFTPKPAPKAIEVIAPKSNLLEGLPIMQAIATHGVEDTKAALNVVHERVVAEALNGNNLLVAEGQA